MKRLLQYLQNFFNFLGRLFLGRFWIPVGVHAPHHIRGFPLPCDARAVPRSDPCWREQWRWVVLKPLHTAPFHVYFESPEMMFCMRYAKKIRTPYVAMRICHQHVFVTAISDIGHGHDPVELDIIIGPATRKQMERILTQNMISHQVTWI